MNLLVEIGIAALSTLLSYIGVELFRRESIRRKWFDIPNERSLHSRPTPRGGGLVIVLLCIAAYAVIGINTPAAFSWGFFTGALLLSGVSWADDLYSISIKWRLTVQFVSALLVVFSNGHFVAFGGSLGLGAFGLPATLLWIVWIVNAYNFMDGIDGIASVQAVIAAAAWGAVALMFGDVPMILFCAVIIGTTFGFLLHNWDPARVFLGDVGSAFFGYTFASLPLLFSQYNERASWLPVAAVFFLWPFVFDSAITLMRRLTKGKRVWTPHREHLYQSLIITGYSHSSVSLVYLAFAALSAASFFVTINYPGNSVALSAFFLTFVSALFVGSVLILTRKAINK